MLGTLLDSHPSLVTYGEFPFHGYTDEGRLPAALGLLHTMTTNTKAGCLVKPEAANLFLRAFVPTKVIFLARDVCGTAISQLRYEEEASRFGDERKIHYKRNEGVRRPLFQTIVEEELSAAVERVKVDVGFLREAFEGLDTIDVTYEDITMGEDIETIRNGTTDMILKHLDVELMTLHTGLKKGVSRYDKDGRG